MYICIYVYMYMYICIYIYIYIMHVALTQRIFLFSWRFNTSLYQTNIRRHTYMHTLYIHTQIHTKHDIIHTRTAEMSPLSKQSIFCMTSTHSACVCVCVYVCMYNACIPLCLKFTYMHIHACICVRKYLYSPRTRLINKHMHVQCSKQPRSPASSS